jgi:hypothetical protein
MRARFDLYRMTSRFAGSEGRGLRGLRRELRFSPYLESPELVGSLISSGGYETTEYEIFESFPTRDASVTQEEGLSLVRRSCRRLDERVSSLRRIFGATLPGGGLEERAANVVSIRDSPTVPAARQP